MKKKLFIIALLSFVFILSVDGQSATLGKENDFVFSNAGAFCNGLARVKFGEKWGFVNNLGNIVVNFDYEDARDFKDGFARVKKNGRWGFIDISGKIVIPFKYENACPFNEGLAGVQQNGKWGFVDTTGRIAVEIKYEPKSLFEALEDHHFKNGYAAVWVSSDRGNYGVLIDKNGNVKTPTLKYARVSDYCDGLARVMVVYTKDGKREPKLGYINIYGEEIIKPQYSDADDFVNGYAIVAKDGKYGIINKSGNVVVDFKYSTGLNKIYQGGMARFTEEDYNDVLVDMKGKVLIPPIYKSIIIDEKGSTDLIMVKNNNKKWGWININNKVVIPLKYDESRAFNNGYAAVAINNKWGVINKTGQVVLPIKYEYVNGLCFTDGYCLVKLNGNYGFIDKVGKTLKINLGKEMYEAGLKEESNWDGSPSTKKYLIAAIDWFKKSALEGNKYACFKVGYYNYTGAIGKKNYAEAVKWLEKCISIEGESNGMEYCYLGEIYKEGGYGLTKNETKAIKYLSDGAMKKKNAECYNLLAYIYASKKNYSLALDNINKAIEVTSNNIYKANYYDSKGEIYLMMGKTEEAIQMWKKVIELNPKFLEDYPQGTELYNQLKKNGIIK